MHLGVHDCIAHIDTYRYTDETFGTCLSSACVLLNQKTSPHSVSLFVRQAFLSLSHLGSPCPCLLHVKPSWFRHWWLEACVALQVESAEERKKLCYLSPAVWYIPGAVIAFSTVCLHCQSVVDESIHDLPFCHGQLPLQVTAACLPAFVCTYGWGSCLSHPRNALFFHAGSCSLNFKFIIFCHTLVLLSSHSYMSKSHHYISLA